MAENNKICSSCDTNKTSNHCCSECDQTVCQCFKILRSCGKAIQNHLMVSIESNLPISESFPLPDNKCRIHKKQLKLFCSFHQSLLCKQCRKKHPHCRLLVPISQMTKGIKESETVRKVQQGLSDAVYNANVIEKTLERNRKDVEDQTHSLVAMVELARQSINTHPDKKETLKNEIMKTRQKLTSTMSKYIEDITVQKSATEWLGKKLEALLKNGSEFQVFVCIKEVTYELSVIEGNILKFTKNNSLDKPTVILKSGLELSKLNNIEQFDSIYVENDNQHVFLRSSKNIRERTSKSISDIFVKKSRVIKTSGDLFLGCIILPNGQIAITDYGNDNVVLISTKGKCIGDISLLPYRFPNDLTYITDCRVAVGCAEHIVFVDVQRRTILESIKVMGMVDGVVYNNSNIVIGACAEIRLVDLDSYVVSEIPNTSELNGMSVAIFKEKLYFTFYDDASVNCIKLTGEVVWKFKNWSILRGPWGVSVDCNGNVYVICYIFHHVLVLSDDGQKGRVLITNHVVKSPMGLFVDRDKKQLLVTNRKCKVYVFDLL